MRAHAFGGHVHANRQRVQRASSGTDNSSKTWSFLLNARLGRRLGTGPAKPFSFLPPSGKQWPPYKVVQPRVSCLGQREGSSRLQVWYQALSGDETPACLESRHAMGQLPTPLHSRTRER